MADCGVCLSGYDGDTQMYQCKMVKASRNEWACEECGATIPKGSMYELSSGMTDGDFWTIKTCMVCAEIANAFSCNGRMHGTLWNDMEYVFPKLNEACFTRLKTVEAKRTLQNRWIDWKGL